MYFLVQEFNENYKILEFTTNRETLIDTARAMIRDYKGMTEPQELDQNDVFATWIRYQYNDKSDIFLLQFRVIPQQKQWVDET